MNEKELSDYRMTESDLQKWNQIQKQIISDCKLVKTPPSFSDFIKTKISPTERYGHTAGYCNSVGFFYVAEGDRGELFLECASHNPEDMRWYIMERILTHIGQELELDGREIEEKNWRYPEKFKNGKLTFEENKNWIYDAVYDSRKFWFEYAIVSLAKLFEKDWIYPYVTSCVNLMNLWFDVPHWDFSWDNMCFVEINDSKEHD